MFYMYKTGTCKTNETNLCMDKFLTRDSIVRVIQSKTDKTKGNHKQKQAPAVVPSMRWFDEPQAGYVVTNTRIMYKHKDGSLVDLHIDCPYCNYTHC